MGELAIEANEGVPAKESERPAPQKSGRYSIEQREPQKAETLPPMAAANHNGSAGFSVNALSDEELSWIEERTATTRRPDAKHSSLPPAFDKAGPSEDAPPTLSALRPYYREPTLERVQLQFEDKSLDPTQNPLALSSLQPPRKRRAPNVQAILTGVGALALVGVGYLAALAGGTSEPGATTTIAPASAPSQPAQPSAPPSLAVPVRAEVLAAQPSQDIEVAPVPSAPAQDPTPETEVLWSVSDLSAAAVGVAAQGEVEAPSAAPQPAVDQAKPELPTQPADAAPQPRRLAPRHVVARPTPAPSAGLPPLPSREQIQAGIEGMRAALQSCAGAAHGTTTARLTILGTGRVASATIEGAFAGSTQGSCMARALRTAMFPRFASENLQVTYPFRL